MLINGSFFKARQIKIAVVGNVHGSGLICNSLITKGQPVVVIKKIPNGGIETAGISLFSLWTAIRKDNSYDLGTSYLLFHLPVSLIKAFGPAVQMIASLVGRHLIPLTIDNKPRP